MLGYAALTQPTYCWLNTCVVAGQLSGFLKRFRDNG